MRSVSWGKRGSQFLLPCYVCQPRKVLEERVLQRRDRLRAGDVIFLHAAGLAPGDRAGAVEPSLKGHARLLHAGPDRAIAQDSILA